MGFELDHIFIGTSAPDILETSLTAGGIAFTQRRVHEGQGTANACAVFENAFLEILWATKPTDVRSDVVAPLGLDERIRWRETGACPFGLSFRPTKPLENWPFQVWQYAPAYAPVGMQIVTPPKCLADPLVFITIRGSAEGAKPWHDSPLHAGARRTLTRVVLHRPQSPPLSPGVRWFVEQGFFSVPDAPEHGLELEWDGGQQGRSHQFATKPPIVLLW